LLERETGKVRTSCAEHTTERPNGNVASTSAFRSERKSTPMLRSFEGLESECAHKVVDHAEKYVNGNVHTNRLENF